MKPLISVCIVSRGRPFALARCLESLAFQSNAPEFEVLVASDDDPQVVTTARAVFPSADVTVLQRSRPGAARNLLIERARGELLLFLDDDVIARPGMLAALRELSERYRDVDIFGGPNLTPPESTRFQKVQGAVLGSMVATGPVRRRYANLRAGAADERFFTLCNLAVRRSVMQPFPTEVVCAEENAVLAALHRDQHVMHYDPELAVDHDRRPSFRTFAAQLFKYGHGRGQVTARRPLDTRPMFLAPAAFVLYLATVLVITPFLPLIAAPLAAYASVVAGAGVAAARRTAPRGCQLVACALVVTVHVMYGLGIWYGLLRRSQPVAQQHASWIELSDAPV